MLVKGIKVQPYSISSANNNVKSDNYRVKTQSKNQNLPVVGVREVITFVGKKLQESFDTLNLLYTTDTHRNFTRLSKLKSAIDKYKNGSDNTLFLHAGDYGLGNRALAFHVGLLNKLGVDLATIGNHEFFDGLNTLKDALKQAEFQTVVSNLNVPENNTLEPLYKNKKIQTSVIREIDGKKYGFVGAVTEDLNDYLRFLDGASVNDTAEVLKEEVKNLEAQGVNKIILISHLGYHKDVEIAKNVSGIDVIVGGHTHFAIPGIKKGVNLFENTRNNGSKEPVLILHAGAHNHLLGLSKLIFDQKGILQIKSDAGKIKSAISKFVNIILAIFKDNNKIKDVNLTNNKLLQVSKFERNQQIEDIVNDEISQYKYVGKIKNDVSKIWPIWNVDEMGSLIADAVKFKTGCDIALIQGGCYKRGIDKGILTVEAIKDFIIPFSPDIVKVEIAGKDILAALNHGASCINRTEDPGLMQVSGIKYAVDMNRPEGSRVINDQVFVKEGDSYVPLNLNKTYITSYDEYLYKGGSGLESLKNGKIIEKYQGVSYAESLIDYIKSCKGQKKISDPNYADRIRLDNYHEEHHFVKKICDSIKNFFKSKDIVVYEY